MISTYNFFLAILNSTSLGNPRVRGEHSLQWPPKLDYPIYPLVNVQKTMEKITSLICFMGKSTISMAMASIVFCITRPGMFKSGLTKPTFTLTTC